MLDTDTEDFYEKWRGLVFSVDMSDEEKLEHALGRVRGGEEVLRMPVMRFGDEGGVRLARALKYNITVKDLDLDGNGFTDTTGLILADALATNRCLETLQLWSNPLTERTGAAFIRALMTNKRSRLVNLFLKGAPAAPRGRARRWRKGGASQRRGGCALLRRH